MILGLLQKMSVNLIDCHKSQNEESSDFKTKENNDLVDIIKFIENTRVT